MLTLQSLYLIRIRNIQNILPLIPPPEGETELLYFGAQKNPDESFDCQGFKIGISHYFTLRFWSIKKAPSLLAAAF